MTIFDLELPEWASVNEDGVWCDVCGEIQITPWQADDDTEAPEYCRQCGAPDVEEIAEFFA